MTVQEINFFCYLGKHTPRNVVFLFHEPCWGILFSDTVPVVEVQIGVFPNFRSYACVHGSFVDMSDVCPRMMEGYKTADIRRSQIHF